MDGSPAAPTGPLIRLVPASGHPDLAHTANLRQLASRAGLRIRVLGRLDPDRATTLRPLAVGPVPYAEATLRLPAGWLDRADLGYDRLQGSHLPPREACPAMPALAPTQPDPMADAPLWRFRHLVELAVAGGAGRSASSHAPVARSGVTVSRRCAARASRPPPSWPPSSPPRRTAVAGTPSAGSPTPTPTATPGRGSARPYTSRRPNVRW
jgi:hypothetical protein